MFDYRGSHLSEKAPPSRLLRQSFASSVIVEPRRELAGGHFRFVDIQAHAEFRAFRYPPCLF